jgi:hypothetical protein
MVLISELVQDQTANLVARTRLEVEAYRKSLDTRPRKRGADEDDWVVWDEDTKLEERRTAAAGGLPYADLIADIRGLELEPDAKREQDDRTATDEYKDFCERFRRCSLRLLESAGSSLISELHGTRTVHSMFTVMREYFYEPAEGGKRKKMVRRDAKRAVSRHLPNACTPRL